jgi:flagellar hook-length control protein FliK
MVGAPVPRPVSSRQPALLQDITRSVVDQVVRGMELHIAGKASEMHLRLEPETLGEIGLRVRMDEGRLQAQIDVSHPSVKAALEGSLPQLREALAAEGIYVERLDVLAQGESYSREAADGQGGRGRRRAEKDTPEQEKGYENSRQLGYNTIELVM